MRPLATQHKTAERPQGRKRAVSALEGRKVGSGNDSPVSPGAQKPLLRPKGTGRNCRWGSKGPLARRPGATSQELSRNRCARQELQILPDIGAPPNYFTQLML